MSRLEWWQNCPCLGLPPLLDAAGLSLVPLMRHGEPLPERTLFVDAGADVSAYRGTRFARKTLFRRGDEFGWDFSAHTWKPDGSWGPAANAQDLEREVREHTKDRKQFLRAPMPSDDTKARLRALGYIE